MKPGSIVVIMPFEIDPDVLKSGLIKWMPIRDEKTPYTIREITLDEDGDPAARFEEGCMGFNPHCNQEFCIGLNKLIELLPPESISIEAILEETNLQPA